MANLRTDYVDDELDVSVNENRRYRMIDNGDGTVSFEDVTEYLQQGDNYGSAEVNEQNETINQITVDLSDGLAKKVNISDIVNSLGSTDTNKPLSANRGKELNDKFSNYVSKNSVPELAAIELKSATPYIDFHFNNSDSDHTSRIIESTSGTLRFISNVQIDGDLRVNRTIYSKTDNNIALSSTGWGLYGSGIAIPEGTYIVIVSVRGAYNNGRISEIGTSYGSGHFVAIDHHGIFVDAIKYDSPTTIKPYLYIQNPGQADSLTITAVRVG